MKAESIPGPEGWLLTIWEEGQLEGRKAGKHFELWTEPPRSRLTGELRLRKDGRPFKPAWRPGHEVVVYEPERASCPAMLCISSDPELRDAKDPEWRDAKEPPAWWVNTKILAIARLPPTLKQLGIETAVQGGRQRLTSVQLRAARSAFGLNPS